MAATAHVMPPKTKKERDEEAAANPSIMLYHVLVLLRAVPVQYIRYNTGGSNFPISTFVYHTVDRESHTNTNTECDRFRYIRVLFI